MTIPGLTDIVLAAILVLLAGYALSARTRIEGVIVFMLFGLLMAVAWIRVEAPDLALTEAAIGSGVTGAMLLGALRRLRRCSNDRHRAAPILLRGIAAVGCLALALLLSVAIRDTWHEPAGLTERVTINLPQSDVANPVTAVILNFRGYDTLLEIGVLLIAVMAILTLRGRGNPLAEQTTDDPVLGLFVRWLQPVGVLTAVYFVWAGTKETGGAFQAGALLAGLGITGLLAGQRLPDVAGAAGRLTLTVGFLVFGGAAAFLLTRGALLDYPPGSAR
ncbi:MAG: DUF4040 domain-containing protein, partial [Verrucomicrobia bacterium]|nr:DUF4040 domain-containing protein [Verrucomicrobiota bacterium]